MSTVSEPININKSAYVALICLIAFVIVITICVIKQFIWDPLLSKPFQTLRPVLSESVRRFSSTFSRLQSTRTSSISIHRSHSDVCHTNNDLSLLSNPNSITVTQSLPANNSQHSPIKQKIPPRFYGSSSMHSYAYTNYGSDNLDDEELNIPTLNFSCEYDPSTYNIKLIIQNLCHMKIFHSAIHTNTYVVIRFILFTTKVNKSYQTSPQAYQDVIRFNEAFIILNNIHSGDILNYQIKFFILLIIDGNTYEIAEGIHSMKEDCLTYVLFVERILKMNLKFIQNETK
jgi:hypothetical protein